MSIVECVIAGQPSIGQTQTGTSPGTPYFLIALVVVVLGLVVLIVIRAKARRSSKR
jgi:hypothetical protein